VLLRVGVLEENFIVVFVDTDGVLAAGCEFFFCCGPYADADLDEVGCVAGFVVGREAVEAVVAGVGGSGWEVGFGEFGASRRGGGGVRAFSGWGECGCD